jgi:hypothetical protein
LGWKEIPLLVKSKTWLYKSVQIIPLMSINVLSHHLLGHLWFSVNSNVEYIFWYSVVVFRIQYHFLHNFITKNLSWILYLHDYIKCIYKSMWNTYSTGTVQDHRKCNVFFTQTINQLLGICNNIYVTYWITI